ncbi:MAG: hypothetical protein HMLKMBBP_01039 [Planctomycetes bacterium]|nr:hypothetical protein [Planctomycetota bacterium]
MTSLIRLLVLVLLAVVASPAAAPGPAFAQDDAPTGPSAPECDCKEGFGACQHFLRNPAGVTADPCWCDKCRSGKTHDGQTPREGWNTSCFINTNLACYLKRHATAYRISCSECAQNATCCQQPNKANCPDCGATGTENPLATDHQGKDAKTTLATRLEREGAFFKKADKLIIAYNPHFYVVSDVDGLKVRTPSGMARPITPHEWVHLTIERAEYARREWVRHLGEPGHLRGRIGMFFCSKVRDQQGISAKYFGGANSKALMGSGGSDRIADGMASCAMALSEQEYSGDVNLQVQMRHQLAHLMFTTWGSHEIRPKSRPQWAEEGLGHWLVKIIPGFEDEVTYCIGEMQVNTAPGKKSPSAPNWSGKGWDKDVVKIANDKSEPPVEKMLAKQVTMELTQEDHKHAWSWIALSLAENREGFAKMLAGIRQEKDLREAFVQNLGCTPEVYDERWKERVTGKRKSMSAESDPVVADNDAPGARERKGITSETDVKTLAAKIRQLGSVDDPKMIAVVIDQIERKNDLVRETAFVTLLKTKEDAAKEAIWKYGLQHKDGIVRAYVARLCGRLKLEEAVPQLDAQLAHENWYARAEAAIALGTFKHAKSMSAMRKMVTGDEAEKARVAAMDALAMFGEEAHMSVPTIMKNLDAPQWQIRVAACQALGAIRSMEAVDALIERMEKEQGRVREDIRTALKRITNDDLGLNPENWRKMWEREKANAPGGMPRRPADKPTTGEAPAKPKDDRYAAPPAYYGVEIYSNRVGFVADTSMSMATLFVPDPAAAKALSREYSGYDKITICKDEIAQALKSLDDRAYFTLVTFGTTVRAFKNQPVPATPGNVDSAIGFLKSIPANGETNYYDALKITLDIGDEPDTNPNFRATPDTITFLTDGEPTKGDMTDGDTLVEWYTGLNRYARITTHTITFGNIGIDMPLLHALAERNGGKFVLVPEKTKGK